MHYTAQRLAEITNAQLIGNPNKVVKNLAFDSRTIYSSQDTAFLAIKTEKNNGEKYIASAVEKGISVIIAEQKTINNDEISWILVENTLDFVQRLAQYHYHQYPITSIGITGSNGKTIIKEWLYQSLSDDYSCVKSPKSFNSQLGLPLSLLKINSSHQIGIFEAGISKPSEMTKLQSIFSPKIGILTHIGSAHIAHFDNQKHLIEEKITLFKNSEVIIFNGDNNLTFTILKEKYSTKHLISYGLGKHNDVHIISDWKDRTKDITVSCLGAVFTFPVHQRDEATLVNALAVISLLHHLGYAQEKIIEKINHLKSVEMRLEAVNGVRDNLIINDSFNLDLDSLKIAYQFIKEYNKPNKSLIITDFVEKKNTDELYREVAMLTNKQHFNTIFLIGNEIPKYQSLFHAPTFSFSATSELIKSQEFNKIENHLILIKGARKFETERVKNYLEFQKHDTVLEINLNKVLHNIKVHQSFLLPDTKMMAMVKAHSYGLGGYEIAEFLQHHHIDYLGVAVADEGVELRKKGITTPIIVMNPEQHSYHAVIDYNLEPNIYSFRVLDSFYQQLKQTDFIPQYPIHIKLETGMHRLGFKQEEIDELVQRLKQMNMCVESIFSHLSSADIPAEREYTLQQFEVFERQSERLIQGLGYTPIRHILNSSGILNYPEYQYDMVRIGIGMVGICYNEKVKPLLQPAVAFKSVISQISEIKKDVSVSYGRRYKAEKDTRIATIPVGYADGIPRLLSNGKGFVNIKGHLVPIVGSVCMDMMMVNIKDVPANEGDEVVIFNDHPTLEEFAQSCQTIPYEVLTSISRRVKRVYIKD